MGLLASVGVRVTGHADNAKQLLEMEGRDHEWGRHPDSNVQTTGNWPRNQKSCNLPKPILGGV
jgi:hypothetical protein